ncbi:thiamine pyrophosphate-binding protein, partial [Komagataeibacter europaeus]|uniref:thiamine pyrophosphate-binding protein n=1 Tax=Komagataeibacter europaeus TaxID=33995 RepID=UPI000662A673
MPAQSIGNTLIDIFVEAGIKRIYGVPGDYNLRFLELLESDGRIEFIGTCNELNACYAADGDARISGFAVVTVTYGVGDLGLLSAIAGAYAENVPVLVLSGAPPEYASRSGALLHHTLADGNYTNVLKAFEQFTSAQSTLTAQNAGTELLRLIKVAWTMKLPVYAQLPSDIVDAPSERNTPTPNYCFPSSDKTILSNVINFFVHRLERAHSPVILIDALADRYGVVSDILRIIEKWSLPYAVMPTAKGTCPEDSSLYLGVYFGQKSRNGLFELIGQSDLVIGIGVRFVDSTSAWFSQRIRADAWVNIEATQVVSFKQSFENVEITELVSTWLKWDTDRHPRSTNSSQSVSIKPQVNIVWGQHYFWSQIEAFIEPHDIIIADNVTCPPFCIHSKGEF